MSDKQWVLGDEAATVTKVYGENRLARLAEDGNFPGAVCTLGRYRSVCFAFPKTGGRPRFFASAQVLQAHPDRIQIVTATPNISVRAARELMRLWRAEHGDTTQDEAEDEVDEDQLEEAGDLKEPTPGRVKGTKSKGGKKPGDEEQGKLKESKRYSSHWASDLVAFSIDVIGDLAEIKKSPGEQERWLKHLEEHLVDTVRKGGEALIEIADRADARLEQKANTLIQEGNVGIAPRPAAEPPKVRA